MRREMKTNLSRRLTFLRQHELDQVQRVAMRSDGLSVPCRDSPSSMCNLSRGG